MKVLNESYSELRLKRPPDLRLSLLALLGGGWFTLLPIFMMVMFLQQLGETRLSCNRVEPAVVTCQHQQTGFWGLKERLAATYANVTDASLQTRQGQDEEGQTTQEYWVALATDRGEQTLLEAPIMVNGVKGDPVEMGAIAEQISQFIQSDQPDFAFEQDNRPQANSLIPLAFLALFPTIGLTAMYFTLQSEELRFNREMGLLQRRRQTILGVRCQEIPLHSIEETKIETQIGDRKQYQLKLLPQSLKTRPLTSSRDRIHVAEIETKVKQFLQRSNEQ